MQAKIGVRGQSIGIDLLFATTIFMLIFGVLLAIWENSDAVAESQVSEMQMRRSAWRALDILIKDRGSPVQWETFHCGGDINSIGIAKRALVLDEDKVNQLVWRINGLPRGRIAQWRFNGDALDSNGNGHHGTEQGVEGVNFFYEPGLWTEQAIRLSGGGVSISSIPLNPLLHPDELTISAWVKPLSIIGETTIFDTTVGASGHRLFLDEEELIWTTTTANGGETDELGANTQLEEDEWYLVTGTLGPNGKKLYINGTVEGSNAITSYNKPDSGAVIGEDMQSSTNFSGYVDEVRLYRRALSEKEVLALCEWSDDFVKEKLLIADNNYFFRIVNPATGQTMQNSFGDLLEIGLNPEDSFEPDRLLQTKFKRVVAYKGGEVIVEFTLHRIK